MISIEDLKKKCTVDPASHCWIWHGAISDGRPRLWTLDYARGEKRTMNGPLGAWNIAYQAPPRAGHLVFRACMHQLCLNPAHLREARNKAEIGLHIRRSGCRVGTAIESRRANASLGRIAQGIVDTPGDVVQAVRAAGAGPSNMRLAQQLGISHQTVSRIRLGQRHAVAGQGR